MKIPAATTLLITLAMWSTPALLANHPVLVEGNCDSPVPGTTTGVPAGTCGDFDGDGRIGTAEDTDGADRIFGTINAALGPGTGAAAGTGANRNGTITIVTSGRFAETITIGPVTQGDPPAVSEVSNVTIEAAPGVRAAIDAVLQGDPAGGNTARQGAVGITIDTPASAKVILRNLVVRNFLEGVRATTNSRVIIENCIFEHNRDFGLRAMDDSRLIVNGSSILGTGFRVPVSGAANPGNGVQFEGTSGGSIVKTSILGSFGIGLSNVSSRTVIYYEYNYGNNDGGAFSGAFQRNAF